MEKTALVIVAADGITSLQTGVGIVVNSFFEAFNEIGQMLNIEHPDLYAITPLINEDSRDFSLSAKQIVLKRCEESGGRILTLKGLISGKSLDEIWKGTGDYSPAEIWDSLCSELAIMVNSLSDSYDRLFIITHDTLFANFSKYVRDIKITVCWIPHSLATLFAAPNQQERIDYEMLSMYNIINRNDFVGYISNDTRDHLLEKYHLPENRLLSFYSGIYFNSFRYKSNNILNDFYLVEKIPPKKKIIFSWGRCAYQKGIDIILKAYSDFLTALPNLTEDYHLILLCPTETAYPEYLSEVKTLLKCLPPNSYTFITKFQSKVQYEILADERTVLTLLCSRFESFGLTSIEAVYHSGRNCGIVYSPIPTFREVLSPFDNAFELSSNTHEDLRDEILKRICSSEVAHYENERKKKLATQYSLANNHAIGLKSLIVNSTQYDCS